MKPQTKHAGLLTVYLYVKTCKTPGRKGKMVFGYKISMMAYINHDIHMYRDGCLHIYTYSH